MIKRFRIAFSFAGEKRDFVSKVAHILAEHFSEDEILYDKYHKAEFSHADLAFHLPKLYHKSTDLIVAVFCPDYQNKEWCGLEWRAIFDLIKTGHADQVMLTRFGYVEGDGLYSLAGYTDLEDETPESAADTILERLAINEGNPKGFYIKTTTTTSSSSHTTIPHNLPALPTFFGREEELKKIADALDPDSRTWGALIDGPGGMGKTSLAVRAAYNVSPDTFEKIVFVSLKSRELDDDGVRDLSGFLISGLAELLNELASEIGQNEITKAVQDQRPRLLLDAFRGTKTLIILDNLESLTKSERDTIFTFVKKLPQGCKAILTSRGRIGSGAEELILQQLNQEAAFKIFTKLSENNAVFARTTEAERLELYEWTGGKPLLLRWTAGQIGRGSCLTISDAIAFLRSCPEGNDPLEFIFGDLVEGFSLEETNILCALTHFSQPAKVEHIADLAGCTKANADSALRSLTNRSLVVPSEELKTFGLVPLVSDFLRKKKPEVLIETGNKLKKHAYALIIGNANSHEQFPVLNDAWSLATAALPMFISEPSNLLQTVFDALGDFLNFTGRWDEWLALALEAEKDAVAKDDFFKAGWNAYDAGWVYHLRKQSTLVMQCAKRAELHWSKIGLGEHEKIGIIILKGHAYRGANKLQAAIASFSEALELTNKLEPQSQNAVSCLNDLAVAQKAAGDYAGALDNYQKGLVIAKEFGYNLFVVGISTNLAELESVQKNWPQVEKLSREALELAEDLGHIELIAYNSGHLGKALLRQGNKTDAITHINRAQEIYLNLGLTDLADSLNELINDKYPL